MFKVQYPYYLNQLKSFQDLEIKSPISKCSVKLSRLVAISVSPMLANILVDDLTHEMADESVVIVDGASTEDLEAFTKFCFAGIIPSDAKDKDIFAQLGINLQELNLVLSNEGNAAYKTEVEEQSVLTDVNDNVDEDDEEVQGEDFTVDYEEEEDDERGEIEANFEEFKVEDESFEMFNEETFTNEEETKRRPGRPKGRPKKRKRSYQVDSDSDADSQSESDDDFSWNDSSSPEREESKPDKPRPKRKKVYRPRPRIPKGIKGYNFLKIREKKKFLEEGGTEEEWKVKQEEEEKNLIKRTVKKNGVIYTYLYPKVTDENGDTTPVFGKPKKVVGQRCAKEFTEGTRDETKKFQCKECLFGCNLAEQMGQHEIFHRKGIENAYYCWDCEESFTKPSDRLEHYKAVHSTRKRRTQNKTCQYCPKKFSPNDPDALAKHEEEHRTPEYQNCFQCGAKFQMGKKAAEKHFQKYPFHAHKKCPQCDYECTSFQDHKGHVITDHGGVFKYMCGVCPLLFDSDFDCKEHGLKEHMEEMDKVMCDLCGKGINKLTLGEHMKNMHSEKILCPMEDCKFTISKNRLQRHMRDYHNPQICSDCGKELRGLGHLQRHKRLNHAERIYQCQYCPKAFTQKKFFEDHINIHTGETPHKCKYCGVGFKNKSNMYHHERSVHLGIKREDMKRLRKLHGSTFRVADMKNVNNTNE